MGLTDKPCRQCGIIFKRARRVQPFCSVVCQYWSKVPSLPPDQCWPWGGTINSGGYGIISYNYKTILAHRVACEIKNGPLGANLALHRCDNPPCVNPNHLFPGSAAVNVADRQSKGRGRWRLPNLKGEDTGAAKVVSADVIEMRRMHAEGMSLSAIASHFPVGRDAVWRIVKRKNWRHI